MTSIEVIQGRARQIRIVCLSVNTVPKGSDVQVIKAPVDVHVVDLINCFWHSYS